MQAQPTFLYLGAPSLPSYPLFSTIQIDVPNCEKFIATYPRQHVGFHGYALEYVIYCLRSGAWCIMTRLHAMPAEIV